MKLVLCLDCQDVFKLSTKEMRYCACGNSYGSYHEDGYHATTHGESAVPIGFNNADLARALRSRPDNGMGERFEAFVIPRECKTIQVKE